MGHPQSHIIQVTVLQSIIADYFEAVIEITNLLDIECIGTVYLLHEGLDLLEVLVDEQKPIDNLEILQFYVHPRHRELIKIIVLYEQGVGLGDFVRSEDITYICGRAIGVKGQLHFLDDGTSRGRGQNFYHVSAPRSNHINAGSAIGLHNVLNENL